MHAFHGPPALSLAGESLNCNPAVCSMVRAHAVIRDEWYSFPLSPSHLDAGSHIGPCSSSTVISAFCLLNAFRNFANSNLLNRCGGRFTPLRAVCGLQLPIRFDTLEASYGMVIQPAVTSAGSEWVVPTWARTISAVETKCFGALPHPPPVYLLNCAQVLSIPFDLIGCRPCSSFKVFDGILPKRLKQKRVSDWQGATTHWLNEPCLSRSSDVTDLTHWGTQARVQMKPILKH